MADSLPFPSFTKTWHNASYAAIDPFKNPSLSAAEKKIVVSGGGSGIGVEIVRAFASAGAAEIVIFGRTESTLRKTRDDVQAQYPRTRISYLVADITDEGSVRQVAADIKRELGAWDVLVANAGYSNDLTKLEDTSTAEWFKSFEVNVKGNYLTTREFAPLAAQSGAVLLHISTGACHTSPIPGHSSYCSAKIASTRMFEHFQVECPHIRVTSIHPGVVETQMGNKLLKDLKYFPVDDVHLAAGFIVWAASANADFARGKLLWCNWDVEELERRRQDISSSHLLSTSMEGWAAHMPDMNSEVYQKTMESFRRPIFLSKG